MSSYWDGSDGQLQYMTNLVITYKNVDTASTRIQRKAAQMG